MGSPTHPFAWLPEATQRRGLIVLVVATLGVMAALGALEPRLRTASAPLGIVSFELAGDASAAEAILASWDERARLHAALSLGIDTLYLVLYSAAIALACARVSRRWEQRGRHAVAALGVWLAWGQLGAALCDAVENTALILTLDGGVRESLTRLAWGCAVVKFALVGCGLLYVAAGALTLRPRPPRAEPGGRYTGSQGRESRWE